MKIEPLNLKTEIPNLNLSRQVYIFEGLLNALGKMDLQLHIKEMINEEVKQINEFQWTEKDLAKRITGVQNKIVKQIEKELKIVPKNYYRNLWMAIGIGAFGIPFGLLFGLAMDNMGLLSIWLPFGLAIGVGIGSGMDKKAKEEGRQLDVELR